MAAGKTGKSALNIVYGGYDEQKGQEISVLVLRMDSIPGVFSAGCVNNVARWPNKTTASSG